jgi:hypothetical protein
VKLDLREETRRDNTKGIKDVDKASTVELQRTVDTGSPSKGKAQAVIKRRKDAAAKASKAKEKDKAKEDEAKKKEDEAKKKEDEKMQKDFLKNYKTESDQIKAKLKSVKLKADNPGAGRKALLGINKVFRDKIFPHLKKLVGFGPELEEPPPPVIGKILFDSVEAKLKRSNTLEELNEAQAAMDELIARMGDPEEFAKIKAVFDAEGITPEKFKSMSDEERAKLLEKVAEAKGSDEPDNEDSDTSAENEKKQGAKDKKETNERYVGIHSALKAVQEGKGKKEYPSIRTILNKMNGE